MLRIGLTGNIGSGKTTVRKIFEILGVPVYDSDTESKDLINNNEELIAKIKQEFGADIYTNNIINRKKLAQIVFNNKEKLETINSIVHPFVRNHFNQWFSKQNYAYIIQESAILFETGIYKESDKNIVVYAPEDIRIKRVIKRDNADYDLVKSRIENQLSDEKKNSLSDFIIKNFNEFLLIPQVLEIHNILKQK